MGPGDESRLQPGERQGQVREGRKVGGRLAVQAAWGDVVCIGRQRCGIRTYGVVEEHVNTI